MAEPLLSIGMIVKNEIRSIERCLKALQPLRDSIPCELVIADTGSTDGTREIVQQYADVCFDFEWINDFSAARNAVLDRCSGKWSLSVDADEYLDDDFSQLVDFLKSAEAEQYALGCVKIVNYPDLEMKGSATSFFALRMARTACHLRYSDPIHETLPNLGEDQIKLFPNVIFHHDGYAQDSKHLKRYTKKMERNLMLLDRELKQSPNDLRRLMECLESSNLFPVRKAEYARRSMKVLMKKSGTVEGKLFGPTICCHALEFAVNHHMPELERWINWSKSVFADSIYLKLDGNFPLIKWYMEQKEYEKVLECARTYLVAWKDVEEQNFDQTVLLYAVLRCTAREYEVTARAAGCEALGHLGRTEEAVELLSEEPHLESLNQKELHSLLIAATWSAKDEKMQRLVADIASTVKMVSGSTGTELWMAFGSAANAAFRKHDTDEVVPECPWKLFVQVEGGLGEASRLMDADPSAMQAILPCIENWEDVPDQAVVRTVEQDVELPEGFYTQSKERLSYLATALSNALPLDVLLNWSGKIDFTTSMARFQFLFVLLGALLQEDKTWEEDINCSSALCRKFVDTAADYLPNYYNAELLSNKSEWNALPSLHTFALYLLKGRADLEQRNQIGYFQDLRAALKAAPYMKKTVQYLQEHQLWFVIDPELQSLALRVREILAQYPADDPAVVALKQSEVYQKVAYLIDGMDA